MKDQITKMRKERKKKRVFAEHGLILEINISYFGLWKKAKTDKGEEKKKKKKKKKEEGRRRDQRYEFVWFSVDSSMELL